MFCKVGLSFPSSLAADSVSNTTVYPDFFEDNGFELLTLAGVTGDLVQGMRPFEVELFGRSDVPPGAALYVIAQRRELRPLKWPVQRKYRHMLA